MSLLDLTPVEDREASPQRRRLERTPNAAIWFYFREADYDHIMNLWRHRRQHGQSRNSHDRYRMH